MSWREQRADREPGKPENRELLTVRVRDSISMCVLKYKYYITGFDLFAT